MRSLTLQSSPTSAVIKHGSQSWSLRQKNTSNALILLTPAKTHTSPGSSSEIPETGLKAIATVHDTIELVSEEAAKAAPATKGKWHEKL
jgi:sister chromatid cohesion protein DCC1